MTQNNETKSTMKHTKREPIDPYDCWCMNCNDCIFYLPDEKLCQHPDAPPCNDDYQSRVSALMGDIDKQKRSKK